MRRAAVGNRRVTARRRRQRLAVALGQPARRACRRGDRHLLAEDRPHGELKAVPCAGNTQAGLQRHSRGQLPVPPEDRIDLPRIGRQVEEAAHALHDVDEAAGWGERDAQDEAIGRRRQVDLDDTRCTVDHHAAAVTAVDHSLYAGSGAGSQKSEHRLPAIGRTEAQPQLQGPAGRRCGAADGRPQRARRLAAGLAEESVEPPQAAESRSKGDIGDRERRIQEQRAGEVAIRRVWATWTGVAPRCSRNRRLRWRSPMPSRSASSPTPCSSRKPPQISRRARDTGARVPDHAGLPGAVSGRQRRQGLKPAASASAAQRKKRACSRRGVRDGQTGRQ